MATVSLVVGIILILMGIVGYGASGGASITALIPAFFGIPMIILGAIGRNPERLKLTMHLAMGLMLLGLAGSAGGVPKLIQWLSGGEVARPMAAIMQALMAFVCVIFLGMGVRSFVEARRRQNAG